MEKFYTYISVKIKSVKSAVSPPFFFVLKLLISVDEGGGSYIAPSGMPPWLHHKHKFQAFNIKLLHYVHFYKILEKIVAESGDTKGKNP